MDDAPPIILNIWDKDTGAFDGDDFLGRSVIFLKDASLSTDDTKLLLNGIRYRWDSVIMSLQSERFYVHSR